MRRHLSVLLFSTFLAGPALAQATPPAQPAQPPAQQQQQVEQREGQTGSVQFMQQQQANQWSVEWLTGSNVYNSQNENLGSINDIILDNDGRAVAVVIGVGGFLGIGEKNVAVDFAAIDIRPATDQVVGAPAGQAQQQPAQKPMPQTQAQQQAPTTGQAVPQQAPADARRDGATTGAATDEQRIYLNVTREQLDAAPEFEHVEAQRGVLGGAGTAR